MMGAAGVPSVQTGGTLSQLPALSPHSWFLGGRSQQSRVETRQEITQACSPPVRPQNRVCGSQTAVGVLGLEPADPGSNPSSAT